MVVYYFVEIKIYNLFILGIKKDKQLFFLISKYNLMIIIIL